MAIGLFYKIPRELKIIAAFYIIYPFLVYYITFLAENHINNMFWKHFSWHLKFLVHSLTYYQLLSSVKLKKVIVVLIVAYSIFSVFDTLFLEPFSYYPSNISFVCTGVFIVHVFLLYYQIYTENKIRYLERNAYFWLNSGVLFYYLSTILFSLFYNYVVYNASMEVYLILENIDSIVYILYALCICLTFYLSTKGELIQKKKRLLIKKSVTN